MAQEIVFIECNFACAFRDFNTVELRLAKLVEWVSLMTEKHPNAVFYFQEMRKMDDNDGVHGEPGAETPDPLQYMQDHLGLTYNIYSHKSFDGNHPMILVTAVPKSMVSKFREDLVIRTDEEGRDVRYVMPVEIQLVDETSVLAMNTHLHINSRIRDNQCRRIQASLSELNFEKMNLSGDFNFSVSFEKPYPNGLNNGVMELPSFSSIQKCFDPHPKVMKVDDCVVNGGFFGFNEDDYARNNIHSFDDMSFLSTSFGVGFDSYSLEFILPLLPGEERTFENARRNGFTDHMPVIMVCYF